MVKDEESEDYVEYQKLRNLFIKDDLDEESD
jgi:hypothetical protein